MKYIEFGGKDKAKLAILIKESSLRKQDIIRNYIEPMEKLGLDRKDIIAFSLSYNEQGKAPVSLIKEYMKSLNKVLTKMGVTHLYVCDGNYVKPLCKIRKVSPHYGLVLSCKLEGYENFNAVVGINYQAAIYDTDSIDTLKRTVKTISEAVKGTYVDSTKNIIHSAEYIIPDDNKLSKVKDLLDEYSKLDMIACDIETFSLNVFNAGIGTIAFAKDEHNGFSIAVEADIHMTLEKTSFPTLRHNDKWAAKIKKLLKEFFINYKGTVLYHGITFDAKVLAYELFADNPEDYPNLLEGAEIMTRTGQCTKTITYLATNSAQGNKLGLKDQAQEFAGDWAEDDITDIRKIPLKTLLKYNLKDALACFYVYKKHWPTLVADEQEKPLKEIFEPSFKTLIMTELTGMPMHTDTLAQKYEWMKCEENTFLKNIKLNDVKQEYDKVVQNAAYLKLKLSRKVKETSMDEVKHIEFNPNSPNQLANMLHTFLDFPIVETTAKGSPSTGGDILSGHLARLKNTWEITDEDIEQYHQKLRNS